MKSSLTLVFTCASFAVLLLVAVLMIRASAARIGAASALAPRQDSVTADSQLKEHLRPTREMSASDYIAAEGDLRRLCDEVLADIVNGKMHAAFARTAKRSPLTAEELSLQEELTISQLNRVRPRFGRIIGYEFIGRESAGSSVLRYAYIVKCERHILRWQFIFYKPKDDWLLNAYFWDDNIKELF